LAEEGYAPAQNELGLTYENGWGSLKIDAEAVNWFRKAAERKFAAAQFNLGRMYAAGKGTRQSDIDAYKWFALAAAQGNLDARKQMAEVAKRLTPEQLAQAKQAAR
jgi:TPR repeat protein